MSKKARTKAEQKRKERLWHDKNASGSIEMPNTEIARRRIALLTKNEPEALVGIEGVELGMMLHDAFEEMDE